MAGRLSPCATPATFHLNPTTTNIVLNVTDAPNLTATVEGPLTNNSILLVNDTLGERKCPLVGGPVRRSLEMYTCHQLTVRATNGLRCSTSAPLVPSQFRSNSHPT